MDEKNSKRIWHICEPVSWPSPPKWMSFSTLIILESCPKSWALSNADYSFLWKQRGYPRSIQITAIEGTIIHLALERITKAFVESKCQSLSDECAYLTLKKLGGFTGLIDDCINMVLQPYTMNPRVTSVLQEIRRRLINQVPNFRMHLQQIIARIWLEPCNGTKNETSVHKGDGTRYPLSNGSYSEVELRVPKIGWHGIADLISISPSICEIRDFKTGKYKEQHELQLRLYALLWASDQELNPSGRLVDRLILSYHEKDVEVPVPDKNELKSLEGEIYKRTSTALANLKQSPPKAIPSQELCSLCTVRQLCDHYWQMNKLKEEVSSFNGSIYTDIQLKLISMHGPTSWDCIVESSIFIKAGQSVLLRTQNNKTDLEAGRIIRLINVRISNITEDESQEVVIATMGWNTELFLS